MRRPNQQTLWYIATALALLLTALSFASQGGLVGA